MKDFGQGVPASNFTLYGQAMAEIMVKALENAGPNLTRESLIEGAEAIRDWCCTVCMVPVNMSPTDHRPLEMEVYIRMENGKWVDVRRADQFRVHAGQGHRLQGPGESLSLPDEGVSRGTSGRLQGACADGMPAQRVRGTRIPSRSRSSSAVSSC